MPSLIQELCIPGKSNAATKDKRYGRPIRIEGVAHRDPDSKINCFVQDQSKQNKPHYNNGQTHQGVPGKGGYPVGLKGDTGVQHQDP